MAELRERVTKSLQNHERRELDDLKRRPEGTPSLSERCWESYGGSELEPALRSGAIALVDAQWLVEFVYQSLKQNKTPILSCRQHLPREAFLSYEQVVHSSSHRGQIHIIMLSYTWLHPTHPDPQGTTLLLLSKCCKERLERSIGRCTPRWGIFWDYASLHQHVDRSCGVLRTDEESNLFRQGLSAMGIFFSHDWIRCYKVTQFPPGYPHSYDLPTGSNNCAPYDERGWPTVETNLMSMTKQSDLTIDISNEDSRNLTRRRRAPLLPTQMYSLLQEKKFSNAQDDRPRISTLYSEQFHRRFGKIEKLRYENLAWDDGEVEQLAKVIVCGHAPKLREINLSRNKFGSTGCAALANALASLYPKGQVRKLNLCDNPAIGDDGAKLLVAVAVESLDWILLSNCNIGDRFCEALADSVGTSGDRCSLTRVVLFGNNNISDDGYRYLARFASLSPFLVELFLDQKSEIFQRNETMLKASAMNKEIKFSLFKSDIGPRHLPASGVGVPGGKVS